MRSPQPRTRPALRQYQRRIANTILAAIRAHEADVITVKVARQGGKNEVSSQLEALLLGTHRHKGGSIVKAAPTLRPQARLSRIRLEAQLRAMLIPYRRDQFHIQTGEAFIDFASAAPGAETVGLTASLLLEVDESQDVDADNYEQVFDPMRASTAAPVVFWGTSWSATSLLEAKAASKGAININIPWYDIAGELPAYGKFVERRAAEMGQDNPVFRAHYLGIPAPGAGRMLKSTIGIPAPYEQLLQPAGPGPFVGAADFAGVVKSDDEENKRDATVVAIARVINRGSGIPTVEVVDVARMDYSDPGILADQLARIAAVWRLELFALDATGLGGPIAAAAARQIAATAPACRVLEQPMSGTTKSDVGYKLLASVETDRLHLPGTGSDDVATALRQLSLLRAVYLPGGLIRWAVYERGEHDDHAFVVAFANWAAHQLEAPRVATGRRR